MSYIKNLSLFNIHTGKDIELEFKNGTNIIVGPKGGGKSTLLVLLFMAYKKSNNMENTRLAKATWDILKAFGLKFNSITYSSGVVVRLEDLSKASLPNEEFVTQSDDIKTKINEAAEIEEDKENFIKNLITSQAKPFVNLLDDYFNSFNTLFNIRARNINWQVLKDYEKKPKNYYVELKKVFVEQVLFKTSVDINKTLKSIALLKSYISLNKDDKRIIPYLETLNELINIHYKDLEEYIKTEALKRAKTEALRVIDREIKKDQSNEARINKFEQDSKLFFNDLAKAVAVNASSFYNIASKETTIHLKDKTPSHYGLEIVIDDEITVHRNEEKIFEILKSILYTASRDVTDWIKWLEKSIRSEKPIKIENFSTTDAVTNMLKEKADEKIKLLVDGKYDYNKMSLGQKTSFGLQYKIQTNNNDALFLDQPEDNIDSYTIFSNLIPLIMEKQKKLNQQSFIVTHNPNFGVLTNPKTITTCDLTNKELPYIQIFDPTEEITTREIEKSDSPLAHYLEGGKSALSERYDILIKEKKTWKYYLKKKMMF